MGALIGLLFSGAADHTQFGGNVGLPLVPPNGSMWSQTGCGGAGLREKFEKTQVHPGARGARLAGGWQHPQHHFGLAWRGETASTVDRGEFPDRATPLDRDVAGRNAMLVGGKGPQAKNLGGNGNPGNTIVSSAGGTRIGGPDRGLKLYAVCLTNRKKTGKHRFPWCPWTTRSQGAAGLSVPRLLGRKINRGRRA